MSDQSTTEWTDATWDPVRRWAEPMDFHVLERGELRFTMTSAFSVGDWLVDWQKTGDAGLVGLAGEERRPKPNSNTKSFEGSMVDASHEYIAADACRLHQHFSGGGSVGGHS